MAQIRESTTTRNETVIPGPSIHCRILKYLLLYIKYLFQDNTAKDLLMLWSHEMSCGYSYRMISTVDKERFQQTFAMSAKKYFSKEDYVRKLFF